LYEAMKYAPRTLLSSMKSIARIYLREYKNRLAIS
jgi:hypothetical protein